MRHRRPAPLWVNAVVLAFIGATLVVAFLARQGP